MRTAQQTVRSTPAASFRPEEPAWFSSGRAQWRLRGTAYEVEAEDLGSMVGRCFELHPEAEAIIAARPFAADAPAVLVPGVHEAGAEEGRRPLSGATLSDALSGDAAGREGMLRVRQAQPHPAREVFEERVAEAIALMRQAGPDPHALRPSLVKEALENQPLEKVVLGRRILLPLARGASPGAVAARLRAGLGIGIAGTAGGAQPGYGFSLPLSHGGSLVGRSPELLLRREGRQVETVPLAGSAPRTGDARADEQSRQRLLSSAKDLREHRYVVRDVVEQLRSVCTQVSAPETPEVFGTETMLHLGTPIRGTLAGSPSQGYSVPGVFALAELLHPTPAVCGTPTARARGTIAALEEPRGYFTGLVGWQNREGDGETAVTIRCAEITPEAVEVFAGAGIISDSVPAAEAEETLNKMRTVLRALDAEGAAG